MLGSLSAEGVPADAARGVQVGVQPMPASPPAADFLPAFGISLQISGVLGELADRARAHVKHLFPALQPAEAGITMHVAQGHAGRC